LARAVVPRHEVTQIYHRTVVSTRISSNHHNVVNMGLAPDRVAAATRTAIHPVTLRETSQSEQRGLRAERLEAGGRTLAVYRPVAPNRTGSERRSGQSERSQNSSVPTRETGTTTTSTPYRSDRSTSMARKSMSGSANAALKRWPISSSTLTGSKPRSSF